MTHNISPQPQISEPASDLIEKPKALIFSIQGQSIHDGPGARTTVFLCGCPLNCLWCSNPEGLFHHPVMMWREQSCIRCGRCIEACPHNAISIAGDGRTLIHNREFCDPCQSCECVNACLNEAKVMSAKYYTIEELLRIFHRDRQFWGTRGGVTFSGGEPLMHKNLMKILLPELKKRFIHVTLETTLCVDTEYLHEVIPHVEWIFSDIKLMDPDKHRRYTGVDNSLILKHIKMLASEVDWNGVLLIRIPVIPGVNDDENNIRETARFVAKDCGLDAINILPFHRLGESKYRQVGQTYKFEDMEPPRGEHMQKCKKWIEEEGLMCFVGHETPF